MDILEPFKSRHRLGAIPANGQEILFMIAFTPEGRAVLRTTDRRGREVQADHRHYRAGTAALLRSLSAIREDNRTRIVWGAPSTDIFLDGHPHLMDLLMRSGNLVDESLRPVIPSTDEYTMGVVLSEEGDTYVPRFHLLPVERTSAPEDRFRMVTDAFALVDGRLVAVRPIGADYLRLPLLAQPFRKDLAESYLSVLLSTYGPVEVSLPGREWEDSDTPLLTRPTLIFEKVDEDGALYLRLTESVPGIAPSFVEDFAPTRLVTFYPDGRAVSRPVQYQEGAAGEEELRKRIVSQAPSRKAGREIYEEDGLFIVPPETAGPFLLHEMAALAKAYHLVGAEKLSAYKVRVVTPVLRIGVTYGIDFLEGDGSVDLQGERFSLSEFLSRYRTDHYIQLSDGDKAIIDPAYVQRLERLVSRSGKGKKVRISFFDLPEVSALLSEVPDCEIFHRSRTFYEGFNGLAARPLETPRLEAQLRPYQQEGVKWLRYLYDNGMGGCLADDMGLGKTVQTIALLTLVLDGGKALIVMPRSLLFNWKAELERFAPGLSAGLYYGPDRNLEEALRNQVVLTTYAVVRNDIEVLSRHRFDTVVLDESQHIKNRTARMTQAVFLLQADHRFALSGTPVENHLGELYSLFRFLNPAMFGSAEDFNARYAVPIQKEADKEAMQQLRRKIAPFLLRRLKKDVLAELPDRIDQPLYVEMEPEHAAFYERKRRYYYETLKTDIRREGMAKAQFEMLQALTELRRIASVPESLSEGTIPSSKVPVLVDAVLEAVENGHKVVVFFNFIAGIELLGEALDAAGVDYDVMTGSTRDRKQVVGRFQADARCKVLLMTLKTGGVGLNLTAADTVFIAEPWWNRAAEDQAVGRLHRIGQKSVVHAFALVTRGTIEEKIRELQQRKADLVEGLIQADDTAAKYLTEEDIDFILG